MSDSHRSIELNPEYDAAGHVRDFTALPDSDPEGWPTEDQDWYDRVYDAMVEGTGSLTATDVDRLATAHTGGTARTVTVDHGEAMGYMAEQMARAYLRVVYGSEDLTTEEGVQALEAARIMLGVVLREQGEA